MKLPEFAKNILNYKNKIQLIFVEKTKSLWSFLKSKYNSILKRAILYLYNSLLKIKEINSGASQYLENQLFNSPLFRICIYLLLVFLSVFVAFFFEKAGVTISADALSGLAASIGAVIGGAIAIVFTLSTFILQSTSDLFSTQYLNKFIENKSERRVFLVLVLFSVLSFIISFISGSGVAHRYLFTTLIFVVSCSFYLIYILYKDLRRMINPETTLIKIKNKAISELQKIKKLFSLSAKLQGFIYSYNDEQKSLLMDTQYRSYPVWKEKMLIYIKQLYEISLRLLAKNEIETTKLAIKYIHDIHKKHLELRNGNFVKVPALTLLVVYTFDDQGFTTSILEFLESYANRILQENRKENIQHLLQVYQSILFNSLNIEFAKTRIFDNGNPVATLVLGYYSGFAENIIATKDINSIWEMIKTTKNIQQIILQKNNDPFLLETIDSIFEKLSMCFLEHKEVQARNSFTTELVQIFLDRIILSWDKYSNDKIFWDRLFKNLKKHLLVSSLIQLSLDLSLSNILIHFREWQINIINSIFEIKDETQRKKKLDNYLILMENWSNFLLDFSRDFGINANSLCLQTIMSVEQNTKIINFIEDKTKQILDKLYRTQFNILSWYFHKTNTTIDNYHSVELTNLLQFLIWEVVVNLENKIKVDFTNDIINLYINIIDGLFGKVKDDYGFDLPRVTIKLVPLGVILSKYNHKFEQKIIDKINDLNDKYLKKHQESWRQEIEKFGKKVTRPDEYQLCFEISELNDSVFSYNAVRFDIEQILNKNITEEQWQTFIEKIEYCKNVEYTKREIFPGM